MVELLTWGCWACLLDDEGTLLAAYHEVSQNVLNMMTALRELEWMTQSFWRGMLPGYALLKE